MKALYRIWQVALCEWHGAMRSRRALVMMLLYLLSAAGGMYATISIFNKMEHELGDVLQLPDGGKTGTVSKQLWTSTTFQHGVKAVVGDDAVYENIKGRHPVELVYAWFVFLCIPMLVVMVAGNRVADDLHSGAVRYSIVRCTRAEWSMGKAVGQVLMIGVALGVGTLGAWGTAVWRLAGVNALELLPSMLDWGLRAWLYSIAWLGVAMGASHVCKSGSKATSLGITCWIALVALPGVLKFFAMHFDAAWLLNFTVLSPSSADDLLWRAGLTPLVRAAFHLATLGALYLTIGYAVFRRRDA